MSDSVSSIEGLESAENDPLWNAVVAASPACPDAPALAALGTLMRNHAQVSVSAGFAERVCAAARETSENDLIDALYNGDDSASSVAADPSLARLQQVTRHASTPPDPIHMLPGVLDGLRRSQNRSRRTPLARDDAESTVGRWRVWSSVIFGHVAALIAASLLWAQYHTEPSLVDTSRAGLDGSALADAAVVSHAPAGAAPALSQRDERLHAHFVKLQQFHTEIEDVLQTPLPQRWSQLRGQPDALFLVRQDAALKKRANDFYGSSASTATVHAGLRWLRSQQQANGSFGDFPARSGSRHLATHALATLAMLANGTTDSESATSITTACSFIQTWIDDDGTFHFNSARPDNARTETHDNRSDIATGMALLCLVEAAVLLHDDTLHACAQQAIARHLVTQTRRHHSHPALNGYFLLAVETAQLAHMQMPHDALTTFRQHMRQAHEQGDSILARMSSISVANVARHIAGFRDSRLQQRVSALSSHKNLLPMRDKHHRADPLAWFFPTLAMRDADNLHWQTWNTSLQRALITCFTYDNVNKQAWIPSARIRHAHGSDVFATSIALLNLQAAYRYISLR